MENMGMNAGGPDGDVKNLLLQGFRAAKEGRREEAYQLFCDVVARDPNNEYGWLYRAATTDSRSEAYDCLDKVLSINPNNVKAQRGLERIREEQQAEGEEEATEDNYGYAPGPAEAAQGAVGSADVVSGFPPRASAAPPVSAPTGYPYQTEGPQAAAYPGYPGVGQNEPVYNSTEAAVPNYSSYDRGAPPPPDSYGYGAMDTQPQPGYDNYYQPQAEDMGYQGGAMESPQQATKNRLRGGKKGNRGRDEAAAFGAGEATDLDRQGRDRQRRTRSALLIPLLLLAVLIAVLIAFLLLRNNQSPTTTEQASANATNTAVAASGTGGAGNTAGTTAGASDTSGAVTTGGNGATTAAGNTTGTGTTAGGGTSTTAAAGNTGGAATTAAPANTTAAPSNTTAAPANTTAAPANTTAPSGGTGGTAAPTKPILYTVRSGDALIRIANQYATSPDAIRAANRYTTPITGDRIFAGNRLIIPVSRPDFRGSGHIVAQGDTLDSIAAKYGTTADAVIKLNGLAGPTDIKVGDPLLIP
jgi:LysM repeat protein